jgi:hypothetical protein
VDIRLNIRLDIRGKTLIANYSDDAKERAELVKFTAKILQEPLQVRLLSDRVHKLLIDDLRQQKERAGRNYEGRL